MWQWHCTTFSIFAFDVTGPMLYKCVKLTHLYNIGPVTSNANILNVVQCHCHMDRSDVENHFYICQLDCQIYADSSQLTRR